MKKVLFAGIFLLVCGLFAFDRDFSVRGSGADAPGLLQVFRRGKGYVFVLEAARPSVVTVQKGGKELFQFSTEKPEFRLFREKLDGKYSNEKVVVLGPVAPKVAKISNNYRERLIIKCKNSPSFRKLVSECLKDFANIRLYNKVTAFADINPESII